MPGDADRCDFVNLHQRHVAVHDDREPRSQLQALLVEEFAFHSELLPAARNVHELELVRRYRLPALRFVQRFTRDLSQVSAIGPVIHLC